ncbi:transposase [Paenibacillus wulumuqiensis]|uniref:transposase n=1 Tax=Paenibacillus wulumuqiensis TaxID=1567107 RepID=UPI00128D71F9
MKITVEQRWDSSESSKRITILKDKPIDFMIKKAHGVHGTQSLFSNSKKEQWTPAFTHWMRRKRKQIETVFSILVSRFALTSIRSKSLTGFKTNLYGVFASMHSLEKGYHPKLVRTSTTDINNVNLMSFIGQLL